MAYAVHCSATSRTRSGTPTSGPLGRAALARFVIRRHQAGRLELNQVPVDAGVDHACGSCKLDGRQPRFVAPLTDGVARPTSTR